MKVIHRISATVTASINGMLDQIENHEAVANVALADIREALMNAKFQIRRVQNEKNEFQKRLDEIGRDESRWTARALEYKDRDPEKALECARRLRSGRETKETLTQQLLEHAKLEEQLIRGVQDIERKFEDLKIKRSVLVARQSRSQAMTAVHDQADAANPGGVFDRWEQKVMRGEVFSDLKTQPVDEFDRQFRSEEERRELEEILKNLNEPQKKE